ncbi:hypothetical protein BDF19DRAFT_441045 [Syncephalis fuscata]|nr:hypothetical protein BDF19DRAFT_441045 [Syncephalis fuscata]
MSFTQFLFGNVNEEGAVDGEYLDLELQDSLQQGGAPSILQDLFSAETFGLDEGDADSNASIMSPAFSWTAPDAMDFSDFQELAEDSSVAPSESIPIASLTDTTATTNNNNNNNNKPDSDPRNTLVNTAVMESLLASLPNGIDVASSLEWMQQLPLSLPAITEQLAIIEADTMQKESPIDIVKRRYPNFEPDQILKFSELFAERPSQSINRKKDLATLLETTQRPSDKITFPQYTSPNKNSNNTGSFSYLSDMTLLYHKPQKQYATMGSELDMDNDEALNDIKATDFYSVALSAWEDNIQWQEKEMPSSNPDLENGDWQGQIAWDENYAAVLRHNIHVEFNMNDPHMLFEVVDEDTLVNKRRRTAKDNQPFMSTEMPSDLNLSNDKYYEVSREARLQRVRQTFGQLIVQHTLPAIKLQLPYYKIRMSKTELRSFHRPMLSATVGTSGTFQRLKKLSKKEKKVKKRNLSEFIRSAKQLSLRDTGDFVLLEYSEENPPILSNIGMGSMLVNYYRKEDPQDVFIPKSDTDASPFMNFGNVEPGQTITALYNNLVRAPIFSQKVPSTDFLVIKHKFEQETKWYLKEIPSLFVVGQTYPVQEVPGPHARKITTTVKNRLQVLSYRLTQRDLHRGLRITKIAKYFNEFNEAQIRQKLKEFMEYQRGSHLGLWKPKPSMPIPTEQQLRRMVTPEMVCLFESMLVGQRYLEDAGYGAAEDDGNLADADSKLELEQQLAPWIATKNFINAAQGKAMLKLYGPGDPTGCGEGFSFLRISMKDVFIRAHEDPQQKLAEIDARPKSAHRYNVAEQQQAYREEITRIWNTQMQSLSQQTYQEPADDDIDDDEDEDDDDRSEQSGYGRRNSWEDTGSYGRGGPFSPTASMGSSAWDRGDHDMEDDMISLTESQGSRTSGGPSHANRYLIIKRRVRQPNGNEVWEEERVTEPAVISAYLRQRQLIEEKTIETPSCSCIAKQKKEMTFGFRKEGTTRRCGNCGQLGHMKTSRKCPLWNANGEHTRKNEQPESSTAGDNGSSANRTQTVKLRLSTVTFQEKQD